MGRNEICWCGSGKKYKKCHLGRADEKAPSIGQLRSLIGDNFIDRKCLHPNSPHECKGKIIKAHTIQRARTLESLAIDGHVLTFYPFEIDSDGAIKRHKKGLSQASTFTGFCADHDRETFSPVEQNEFRFSPQNAFLLSYRALCHEFFQKRGAKHAGVALQSLIDRGLAPITQREIQGELRSSQNGRSKANKDLNDIKGLADHDLISKDYSRWDFVCLTFSGSLTIAASGATTPNQDFSGKILQVLHDPEVALQHLYISVIASDGAPRIVFGWQKDHSAPSKFIDSLLSIERDILPAILMQYIFAHIENVYFSERWWNNLTTCDQLHIQGLAKNSNAYYFPPTYAATPTVPWSLVSIERIKS